VGNTLQLDSLLSPAGSPRPSGRGRGHPPADRRTMNAHTLTQLAAKAGDTLSLEAAQVILGHPSTAADLANFYSFRHLEVLHQANA